MNLIDVHTHIQFSQFNKDRDDVIRRFRENNIAVVNVGTDRRSSEKAVELAEKKGDDFYATVGQHPISSAEEFDYSFYEKLGAHPRVVAIGECGLDYFHEKDSVGREKQKDLFVRQIELAFMLNKPLMLHCREAFGDLIKILKLNTRKLGEPHAGIAHFFSGTKKDADALLGLGFSFSFGGVTTFTHDYDAVIRHIPIERILLETDAPYVAPAPHRGKRNEPSFITETAKRVAEIKEVGYDELVQKTTENAKEIFKILQ